MEIWVYKILMIYLTKNNFNVFFTYKKNKIGHCLTSSFKLHCYDLSGCGQCCKFCKLFIKKYPIFQDGLHTMRKPFTVSKIYSHNINRQTYFLPFTEKIRYLIIIKFSQRSRS